MQGKFKLSGATATTVISNIINLAQDAIYTENYQRYLNYAVQLMKEEVSQNKCYQHIIFDLDGTLFDTERAILKAWRDTLKEYNYVYSTEDLKDVLGITQESALQRWNITVPKEFKTRWEDNYSHYSGNITFFHGIKDMLSMLKRGDFTLGIVTSRGREEYNKFFQSFGLESIFDIIICAEDTKKHKPNPEPLYKYLSMMNAKPEHCIYVGDAATDIECANCAGMTSGLVVWNDSKFLCADANIILRTPKELCDILRS